MQTDRTDGHVAVAPNIDPAEGDIDPAAADHGKISINQTINHELI